MISILAEWVARSCLLLENSQTSGLSTTNPIIRRPFYSYEHETVRTVAVAQTVESAFQRFLPKLE